MNFLIRWAGSILGLWITSAIVGQENIEFGTMYTLIIAGLILAIVNFFLKPVLVILSLPFILVTLGLFMIVINGLIVWLVSWIYGPFEVANLWIAMVAGIGVGLVNYLITKIFEDRKQAS